MSKVYTLHHFAGSGGTIIARMIGGIDRTVVLSEVHPDRVLPQPFNALFQFQKAYPSLVSDDIRKQMKRLFADEITLIQNAAKADNRILVVRDHLHRDIIENDLTYSQTFAVLKNHFDTFPIYTLRNPLDVWAAFKLNNWNQDKAEQTISFTDFLNKQVQALNYFKTLNAHIFSYDQLIDNTDTVMTNVAKYLGCTEGDGAYTGAIDRKIQYTGASGRSGSDKLAHRPTRWGILTKEEIEVIANHDAIKAVCSEYDITLFRDADNAPPRLKEVLQNYA